MAKDKKKDVSEKEATLRAKLEDMTPFRLKKHAKAEAGISQEVINKAPSNEDLIELCVAKYMKKDPPEWAEDAGDDDDDPSRDDDDDEKKEPSDDDDDDDGDDDDGDDEDDKKPSKRPAKKQSKDDDENEGDEDEKPARTPMKHPVKEADEDLLQSILDLVAVQGRAIEGLGRKVDHLIMMNGMTLRNSYRATTIVDKAFGKMFKQQDLKGMDKVRELADENDEKLKETIEGWNKRLESGESKDDEPEGD